MSPAAKLSGAPMVVVGARISKSGNAMPQPGDLQGLSAPVKPGAKGLSIEINEAVK
jgi:cytochrome c-type biogenesis protein CcmH